VALIAGHPPMTFAEFLAGGGHQDTD